MEDELDRALIGVVLKKLMLAQKSLTSLLLSGNP